MVYDIVYEQGLWKKTGSYREKPKVTFEGRYLIISQSGEDYSFTSTIPVLNTADINHLSVAEVEHYWIGTENEELERIVLAVQLFSKRHRAL
uniref:Transmembrane protein 231 n=1 Tax=Heterorhabditis bacteriophora TaxID=37862 RepID=A0A1I7WML3_HETBA